MRVTTRSELFMSAMDLRRFLDTHKIAKRELAEVMGLTDPAIDHWLTARRRIPPPVIKIVRLIDTNREFLEWFKKIT